MMVCGLRDGGEEAADVPGNLYRDVPQEKVDRILDLASRYPSAGHTEPQEFIVMPDQRTKEELAPQTRRPRADVHDHRPLWRPYETHGMCTVASIVWSYIGASYHVLVRLRTVVTLCLPGRPHGPLRVPLHRLGLIRDR